MIFVRAFKEGAQNFRDILVIEFEPSKERFKMMIVPSEEEHLVSAAAKDCLIFGEGPKSFTGNIMLS